MLNTSATSASDPVDAGARPAEDGSPADGGFDMLLTMAMAGSPLVIVSPATSPDDESAAGAAVSAEAAALGPTTTTTADAATSVPAAAAGEQAVIASPTPAADLSAASEAIGGELALRSVAAATEGSSTAQSETMATAKAPALDEGAATIDGAGDISLATPTVAEHAVPASAVTGSAADAGANDDAPGDRGSRALVPEAQEPEQRSAVQHSDGMDAPFENLAALAPATTQINSASAPASAHAGAPPLAAQLADAAHLAVERRGSSVHLQLQPEGLGAVDLRVASGDQGLAIHIAVDDPATRDLVQAAVGQLSQNLEGRGLSVAHLLVDLATGQGGQDGGTRQNQFEQAAARGQTDLAAALGERDDSPEATRADDHRIDYRV